MVIEGAVVTSFIKWSTLWFIHRLKKKLVITVKLSLVFGREGFKGHLVGIHISLSNPHWKNLVYPDK